MKKSILILVCLLMVLCQVQAQCIIRYDFKTKKLDTVKPLKLDDHASFRINNINKFLYEVSITAKQREFHTEVPVVFRMLEQEKQQTTGLTEVAEKTVEQQAGGPASETIKNIVGGGMSLRFNKDALTAYKENLSYLIALPDSVKPTEKVTELEHKIKQLEQEIAQQQNTIRELNDILDDEYTIVVAELYREALTVGNTFTQLEESKTLKNRLTKVAMTDGLSYLEARANADELFSEYSFSADPKKLLTSFEKACKKFKSSYELFLSNPVVLKKFKGDEAKVKASVSSLLAEVEALKTAVGKTEYDKIFEAISTLFGELRNRNNFFAVSDPVQAEKDILIFDVKITPRKDIPALSPLETRNFPVKVKIYHGVKIDFSTGVFITSGLYNREYHLAPLAPGSTQTTIRQGKNNSSVQPSLGALMHVSHRTTNPIKPGLSFGLGLTSTDIASATLFIGGGLILGNKERFIISSGLAAGKVDYLKSKYDLSTTYETADLDDELTVKVTKLSWFLSFTYNLTNKEKE